MAKKTGKPKAGDVEAILEWAEEARLALVECESDASRGRV